MPSVCVCLFLSATFVCMFHVLVCRQRIGGLLHVRKKREEKNYTKKNVLYVVEANNLRVCFFSLLSHHSDTQCVCGSEVYTCVFRQSEREIIQNWTKINNSIKVFFCFSWVGFCKYSAIAQRIFIFVYFIFLLFCECVLQKSLIRLLHM